MGFTRAQLEAARDLTVPDILPDPLRLLFVGINPGLWTAAAQAHFARPGNRFWPALHAAGIVDHVIDAASGMPAADLRLLEDMGIGITNVCARTTARADELSAEELREGGRRLDELVARHRPQVVGVLGVTAYRSAFGQPKARLGRQPGAWHGAVLFVGPNPSGLNAHATLASLGAAFAEMAQAAGIPSKRA